MKVLVLPADLGGCGYYRLIWAAEYLQTQGHDVEIQYPTDKDIGLEIHFRGNVADDPDAEIIDVKVPGDADVLVMQRLSHHWHSQVVKLLRAKGVAMVIDMDDDLSSIHPDNKAFRNYHPRNKATPYSWKNVEQACRDATLVTVSTKPLLNVYAKHGRGHVIDNFVPARYLGLKTDQDKVFGWPGTTESHPNDLQVCGNGVARLIADGYEFRVVGPVSKAQQNLRLKQEPPHVGKVSMFNWPSEIAKLLVALAPLAPTQFNTSKSALKLREANSVGVPWVASPRSEYRRFHQASGGGILVDSPRDWYKGVRQLMDDSSLRQDLAGSGYEYMKSQTLEGNAWRFWEAWNRAYDYEKGKRS